jgi:Pentapeptide repeats (8 copies)
MANKEHLAVLRQGVDAWNTWRLDNPNTVPDLSGASLCRANLVKADLQWAVFFRANLCEADLTWANCRAATLVGANLIKADFRGVNLRGANFTEANFRETNFREATVVATVLANVDLSGTRGLDRCYHMGPSHLDHLTLQRSGRLSLTFLRGCGLSDWQIEAARLYEPGLTSEQIADILYRVHDLRATRPIQIHNLFISYSHVDSVFLEHIETNLNERGNSVLA